MGSPTNPLYTTTLKLPLSQAYLIREGASWGTHDRRRVELARDGSGCSLPRTLSWEIHSELKRARLKLHVPIDTYPKLKCL